MDFTREPIIETVITPKEGYKLVVRSSKRETQEEFFVDSVEVVTFGSAIFYRSSEKPKAFILPATDYEVLEVREARIVLKNASANTGGERSIKIAGGRESNGRFEGASRQNFQKPASEEAKTAASTETAPQAESQEGFRAQDRKKDRRRAGRRRPRRDELEMSAEPLEKVDLPAPEKPPASLESVEVQQMTSAMLSSLLAPPPLISETIGRYKEQYKDAFYTKEEQEAKLALDVPSSTVSLEQPEFGSFEVSEDAEEEIYQQRRRKYLSEQEGAKGLTVGENGDAESGPFGENRGDSENKSKDSREEDKFPLEP